MRIVQEFSAQFSIARKLFYLPSALAGAVALALAVIALVANPRRRINRLTALCLAFCGLWQGSCALIWLDFRGFIAATVFIGACTICIFALLKETVLAPWRSIAAQLWRIRYQVLIIPIYLTAFTRWFIPTVNIHGPKLTGPFYWILNGMSFLWALYFLGDIIRLRFSKKVFGIAKNELDAFVVLFLFGLATFVVGFVIRSSALNEWAGTPPLILVLGLAYFTSLMIRREIFDSGDLFRAFLSVSVRGLAYAVFGLVIVALLPTIGVVSGILRVLWSVGLIAAMLALRVLDRRVRKYISRRNISQRMIKSQAETNSLAERATGTDELHAQFIDVLRRWSDGSMEVFLSDAVFAAPWPAVPIPGDLLLLVAEQGWTTPEILDREGTGQEESLAFVIDNQVAALVCCVSESGGKLLAAFKTRDSQRPFVSRELREAHELLKTMQFGLAFVRMRQKLRGNDRLSFYAQYAPQFAHELRNGLYCQSMLLQAVADGRTPELRLADAKLGLERIEQVNRLCDHFFSLGSLFKRPIQTIHFRDTLVAIVDQVRSQFANGAAVQVELRFEAPPDVYFLANTDLFGMALNNLLKNAVEALRQRDQPRLIEVAAEKHFESVHLLVSDNGPGLPEDRKNDPFGPGMSHKQGGLGLGLSIVRDCIESMGGTIGVRLSSSVGTCFEITLRCAEPPGEAVVSGGGGQPAPA